MVCTNFHGQNAHDLQTSRLHAEETCGKKEMEKSLLGLAAKSKGRSAVTPSALPSLTCEERKAFLFHFHGDSTGRLWKNMGFRDLSGQFFHTPGIHVAKTCEIPRFLPYLTIEKGKLKSQQLSGVYQYHRSNPEGRSGVQNESKCFRREPKTYLRCCIIGPEVKAN